MDVPRVVKTQITTGELDPPADLITGVNDGKIQLLEVVKALGEYLTSVEDGVRLKGLTFLSNLIKSTTPNRFNRPATVTLTRFFTSSLDDFDSLPPSLQALLVLSKLPTFDDDATVEVYRAICDNVNMKAYTQVTRNMVYQIFDSFLASHRNALKSMGADFLNSYTKMVDGEKDPRNLMLLFAMDRVILLEFDISQMVEDFFDITFCYFPISFRPPPNDPYGITADDLKSALRACMAATPLFGKMAVPLFLEKFVSAAGPAMKDLMLTMAECFPVYGSGIVGERGTELWEAIKVEILYQSDKGIEAASLSALESLMRTLYPKPSDTPVGLAQDIINQCLKLLEEPEKSTSLAATKALVAMFNSTPAVGPYTISQALPHMFRQFNHPAHPSHRTPILWSLTSLLIAASKLYGNPAGSRQYSHERPFEQFREALMDTLREGLRTKGLKEPAARGCVALSEIPGLWSRPEVEEVVRAMDDIVLNESDGDVRKAVLKSIVTLAGTYPAIIESSTLPLLFHSLPDSSPGISDTAPRDKYRSALSSLSDLCVLPALFETLVIRILNKLDVVASAPGQGDQRECEVAYSFDLLNCLYGVVVRKIEAKHADVKRQFDTILPRLTGLVVEASKGKVGGEVPVWRDRRLLGLVGRVVDCLVWELPAERQAKYLTSLYGAFEKGEMGGIVSGNSEWTGGSPLRSGAPSSEQNLIVIYSSAIQAIRPETTLPFSSPADFLAKIIHWTIHLAPSAFHQHYALELITSFVNKRYGAEGMQEALEGMLDRIWVGDLQDSEKEEGVRKRALAVFLHIVRALALVRHPLAYSSVERVIDILKLSYYDPVIVGEAARGLGVVAKGKGEDKASHLTAKLLWAQKMWNFALPKLMEGDADAKGRERLVYLSAFASLLPLVPASLLASDLSNILPLMIRTLSLPSPAERAHAITSLESLLETSNSSSAVDSLVHKHAEVIVEGLLKSVGKVPEMGSSAAVRGNALKCLAAIPDAIRYETLSSSKSTVLRELGKALDDPVRSVRWEAVECRARWYKYK